MYILSCISDQLMAIRQVRLSKIVCENAGITKIQRNAFLVPLARYVSSLAHGNKTTQVLQVHD